MWQVYKLYTLVIFGCYISKCTFKFYFIRYSHIQRSKPNIHITMARCLVVAIFVSTLALDVVSGCGLPSSMCGDKQLKLSGYHSDCDKTIDKDNTVQEPQISFDEVDAVCCIKFRDI